MISQDKPRASSETRRKTTSIALILLMLSQVIGAAGPGKQPAGSNPLGDVIDEGWKMAWKALIAIRARNLQNFLGTVYDNLTLLILNNPPIASITGFMAFFINLLQPLYVLVIILLGFHLLFISSSPEHRAEAKKWFGWLLVSLVLMSLSPAVLLLLLQISEKLSALILGLSSANIGINAIREGTNVIFGLFYVLNLIHKDGGIEFGTMGLGLLMLLYFMMVLRYLMVALWGILLPVTVFLYSLKPFRGIGRTMLDQTVIWVFVPVAWAIAITAISVSIAGLQQTYPAFPLTYAYLGSFFLFLASPMIILGIMDWMSLGFFVFGTLEATPISKGAGLIDETKISRSAVEEEEVVVIKPRA